MKTQILISDEGSQIVLTPETPGDEAALDILTGQDIAPGSRLRVWRHAPITPRKAGLWMADNTGGHLSKSICLAFAPPSPAADTEHQ